jgi:uncharacterized protein (DUF342 family)
MSGCTCPSDGGSGHDPTCPAELLNQLDKLTARLEKADERISSMTSDIVELKKSVKQLQDSQYF